MDLPSGLKRTLHMSVGESLNTSAEGEISTKEPNLCILFQSLFSQASLALWMEVINVPDMVQTQGLKGQLLESKYLLKN